MVSLVWTLASIYLALSVHFLGHVVAGRLLGATYRPLSVPAGGRTHRASRLLGLLYVPFIAVGSHIHAIPLANRHLRRTVAVAVGAGPLAMLCVGLAWGALYLAGVLPGRLIAAPVCAALFFTCVELVPWCRRGSCSDGSLLLTLLRGGPLAERMCALVPLALSAEAGLRPRDWDPELIAMATAVADGSPADVAGWLYAYYHDQDLSDGGAIGPFFARGTAVLADLPGATRDQVAAELAFIAAYYHRDGFAARAILGRVWPNSQMGSLLRAQFERHQRFPHARVEAALLMVDGRPDQAAARLRETLVERSWPYVQIGPTRAGDSACEREWLAELLEEAERMAAEPSEAQQPAAQPAVAPSERAADAAEAAAAVAQRLPALRRAAEQGFAEPAAEPPGGGPGALLPPLVLALAGLGICLRGDPGTASAAGASGASLQIDLLLGGALALCGLAVVFAVLQARRGRDRAGMRRLAIAGSLGLCVVPALLWRFGIHNDNALPVELIGVWSLVGAVRMAAPSRDADPEARFAATRWGGSGWGSRIGLAVLGLVLFPSALVMVMGRDWLVRISVDSGSGPSALSGNVTEVKRTLSGAPITFRFEHDVSSDAAQAVQDGAAMAEDYYLRTFGAVTQRPVLVEVRGGSSQWMRVGGFTYGHRVVLATVSPFGEPLSLFYQRQAVAHELFHVLQFELSDGRMLNIGPNWLVEGSAELASLSVLMGDQEISYRDMISCEVALLGPQLESGPPLQAFAAQTAMLHLMQQSYALATLGVDNATETRGLPALGIYFRELASSDWKSAFRTAFGRSSDTFYQEFADARGDYPAPHRFACDFYSDD
jgi:hypothetical protein